LSIPLVIVVIAIVQLAKGKRGKGGTITILVLSSVEFIVMIPIGLVMIAIPNTDAGSHLKMGINEGYNHATAQDYLTSAQSKHSKLDADTAVSYAKRALHYAKQANNPSFISQDQKLIAQAQAEQKALSN